MARLISVNVGMPRDIEWEGRTVHTAVWKRPVQGTCRVERSNLEGDGQGDLVGHGGEHRAVFVYQIESYRYWQDALHRNDFELGQFGENFTTEGLPDDQVCIGDRFQIGSALFEVTQPRVTCYRVGIRMREPRMPALLTSSGRPGFYLRVLRGGAVRAGDDIVKVGEADERMTVTAVNALLYLPPHPREQLERALRIEALSPGWRSSFEALLSQNSCPRAGNAGLAPAAATHPATPGFRSLAVTAVHDEAADVLSFTLQSADGRPLPAPLPGQYVVLRLRPTADGGPLFRSYSLCDAPSSARYRFGVKIEPGGVAGRYLREHVRVGQIIDVSSPRGSFALEPGEGPVVLLSAGIGVTPVLSMLHALAAARSTRDVSWIHGARDGRHHPFAEEVGRLMPALAKGRRFVCYSRPLPGEEPGAGFNMACRLSRGVLEQVGVPAGAHVYMCGPDRFMAEMKVVLASLGVAVERIHTEIFGGSESMTPGVLTAPRRSPHPPEGDAATGPLVSFARSGVVAHWDSRYQSLLELAEACDIPVRWSCRAGVCHSCESGLVSGQVFVDPPPLDEPAAGNVLVCCSRPAGDVVIDL